MDGYVAGTHKTIILSQYGRAPNRRGQCEPGLSYLQWCPTGFPPRPSNERRGGVRQQANQMAMPNMMGQPPMMSMAGEMPGNIQQPMANFGFGNNMSFCGRETERGVFLTISGASFE